jgi:hypothetical protein
MHRAWAVDRSAAQCLITLDHEQGKKSEGARSKMSRAAKLEDNASGQTSSGPPTLLKLHASHTVLKKISTALRVRIDPSMDKLGPYIVINDVTSAEVLVIAQIFEAEQR